MARVLAYCVSLFLLFAASAEAQSCLSASDMDAATRSALENSAHRYFDMASKGDVFSLKQNSIPSLASNFGGVESAVVDNKAAFQGAQAAPRPPFLLQAEGNTPIARAEFLCGVFGTQGQTRDSAVFVLPNLPPGNYGVVIMDVNGAKGPYTLSFILQQIGNEWKLGGFYAKSAQAGGHDAPWYLDRARQYKAKGQVHNAWLYFQEARSLLSPLDFMSTLQTDKLYDEAQSVLPPDIPAGGNTVDLPAGGKTYKLTQIFPLGVGNELDLVVKYQSADVSNSTQTFQDNMAVIKALVAKYPELREAFSAVVARAVEPSGRDYGSLLAMKDIK
ncbi:MAG TPA: hypothetical protein VEV41_23860 [Terriglobales bacterium]|nr:hypothetical protein [Terriglobales bacterium]